ncbi:RHS repeat-associated core domain-containing protein [Acanthopleuribacter pedis]
MDYDGAGRLTRKFASEHHYDAAGFFELGKKAGTTTQGAAQTDDWEEYYLYDAFGQRVAKWETASNKVTYSVRDLNGAILTEEDFSTAATNKGQLKSRRQYILFDDKAVYTEETSFSAKGTQTGRKETYRFHDRLGNPAVIWDADQEQPQSQFYEPYGTPTVSSVKTKGAHGFTGHDEDNTGLVYMKARYYEPRMGCFLQPDEARDFNPFLPNSYNLYSYTYQNPANAYDPDGNAVETAWDVANIGIGVASFVYNVSEGNWLDATIDAGGVIIDTAAAATPFVPGGAGAVIKAARAGDKIADGARAADNVIDVRQAASAADTASDTSKTVKKPPRNPYGSKGKPDHQKKVRELQGKARSETKPGEQVLSERRIQGHPSNRRPDVQILNKDGTTRKVFEAERKPNSKRNKNREKEYDDLSIEHETHGL